MSAEESDTETTVRTRQQENIAGGMTQDGHGGLQNNGTGTTTGTIGRTT